MKKEDAKVENCRDCVEFDTSGTRFRVTWKTLDESSIDFRLCLI